MIYTCPNCGAEHSPGDEERMSEPENVGDLFEENDITVARRTTGFSGNITSLNEMSTFAFVVELPCGCRVITVN